MTGSIRLCLVALSLGLGALITPAAASTITYNWLGTVNYIAPGETPGVAIGEKIAISLSLNDQIGDGDPSSEVGRYGASIFGSQVLVVAVDIAGRTDTGMYQFATVLNDHNGRDAFSIDAFSPMTGNTFRFYFGTSDLGALTSDALPQSFNPYDHFRTATFEVYRLGPPQFSGTFATTPLPGSVGLLASGLIGLVGVGWWKSRRLRTTALWA